MFPFSPCIRSRTIGTLRDQGGNARLVLECFKPVLICYFDIIVALSTRLNCQESKCHDLLFDTTINFEKYLASGLGFQLMVIFILQMYLL